jgi:hypothetical protein
LQKPFTIDTLVSTVHQVLAAAEPNSDFLEGNGNR